MRISAMDSQMGLLNEKYEAGRCAYERNVRYIRVNPLGIAVNDKGGFLVVYKPCVRMERMKLYLYCVAKQTRKYIMPIKFVLVQVSHHPCNRALFPDPSSHYASPIRRNV